jgi:NTP pyrophosphatase (non-canonical NTP hydrolase)
MIKSRKSNIDDNKNKKIMSNLDHYSQFVEKLTSNTSNDTTIMIDHIYQLQKENPSINISLLMTSAFGLSSESGEFTEIVKKILYQSKPLNEDNIFHMKRELGDIFFYLMNACRSIGIQPDEVIAENVRKLKNRYPSEKFEGSFSENRQPGDL